MARRLTLLPLTVLAAGVLGLSACAAPSAPGADAETASTQPSPTPSISAAGLPTATPTGTPSGDAQAPVASASYTSCDEIITPAFAQDVRDNGWVGWNMAGQKMGHSPFDSFPGGAPDGQLSCRFGAGPDVATDNVLDLAWARIDESAAQAAQDALVDAGYERIDVSDGVHFALRADDGWADDEGWGATYHFAGDVVRWAVIRDQLFLLRSAT